MKILLASAAPDEVRWGRDTGLVDGVFAAPAMIAAYGGIRDRRDVLADLVRATTLPVSAVVGGVDHETILRDGRELARLSDRIVVLVPFVENTVIALRRLSAEGIKVGAMLVFNAAQAVLAAKAGATCVTVHVDQLDAHGAGSDVTEVLQAIREMFDRHAIECDLLAAVPRNAAQFTACALAGADSIAVSGDVLRSLLVHPLTDRGLDQYLSDLGRRPRARTSP
jgi:transaldolase